VAFLGTDRTLKLINIYISAIKNLSPVEVEKRCRLPYDARVLRMRLTAKPVILTEISRLSTQTEPAGVSFQIVCMYALYQGQGPAGRALKEVLPCS
jgi:hypothetical protein